MCGFSGFIRYGSDSFPYSKTLTDMASEIRHRGPDDTGIWYDDSCGVGMSHVRLSIVDLSSAGHQPMRSECGRFVIAFNGEIYNHFSLREKLEKEGRALDWRGHSDTETLLYCISAWGVVRTLEQLVGMFAFSLWDTRTETLTLARDRMGEKPLYWGRCSNSILFTSELKALKSYPGFDQKIDRDGLCSLLRYNYIPAPQSIYKDVFKLKAGHYLQISKEQDFDSIRAIEYWSIEGAIAEGKKHPFNGGERDAVLELEKRIITSVKGQMLSDVPLGAFLSGGVDSSVIVAMMQKISSVPVQTFTIGFHEPGYNEAIYAQEVAEHLGTNHTEVYVDARDALDVIPKLSNIYCEPFADSSQIPTFLVSQVAKEKVTVALSGDGGDELFGGYNVYQFAPKIWNVLDKLPLKVRNIIAKKALNFSLHPKLYSLAKVLPSENEERYYRNIMSHWADPSLVVKADVNTDFESSAIPTNFNIDSFEEMMMEVDCKQYMPDDILVKVDRAAMANSLETRVPLLDHRIVEFAWSLSLDKKIREGTGKWLLKEVLYRHVPKDLIERPKKGFSIPLADWLRGPLRGWAEELLDKERLEQEGYFYSLPIRKLWEEHQSKRRDHSRRLWSILMFQDWLEKK